MCESIRFDVLLYAEIIKMAEEIIFLGTENVLSTLLFYIIYRTSKERKYKKPMTSYKFVRNFINELKIDFLELRIRPSTSLWDNSLNNKLYIPNVGERKRGYIVCSDRKITGGRR